MLCQEVQMKVVVVRGLERVWEPLASTLARVTSNLASKSISERWINSFFFGVTSFVLSLSEAGICMIYPCQFLQISSSSAHSSPLSLTNWTVDT